MEEVPDLAALYEKDGAIRQVIDTAKMLEGVRGVRLARLGSGLAGSPWGERRATPRGMRTGRRRGN